MTRSMAEMYRATRLRQAVNPFLGRRSTKKLRCSLVKRMQTPITNMISQRKKIKRPLGDHLV